MPFEKCVEFNGKIYCWNSETKKFCKVIMEDIKTENYPPEVIEKIMTIMGEAAEKKE